MQEIGEVSFREQLEKLAKPIEEALHQWLPSGDVPEKILYEAMQYSVKAGGKRFRPVLFFAVGNLFQANVSTLLPYAVALEFIHTYSLIHDDLPAMDNDTLRRGKPTNHVVYGESLAILAGDALLNKAFELLLDTLALVSEPAALHKSIAACRIIGKAAGEKGMIGGQVLDMMPPDKEISGDREVDRSSSEKGMIGGQVLDMMPPDKEISGDREVDRSSSEKGMITDQVLVMVPSENNTATAHPTADRLSRLKRMHEMKTGALIHAAIDASAILCGASKEECLALSNYADSLGLCFQIRDDILDVESTSGILGKSTGKDACSDKETYVSLLGLAGAKEALKKATKEGIAALSIFGHHADFLVKMAEYTAARMH